MAIDEFTARDGVKEIDYAHEKGGTANSTTVIAKRRSRGRPFNPIFNPVTNAGHKISYKESKFLDALIEQGDINKAAKETGYTPLAAKRLLAHDWVKDEMQFRMALIESEKIANAEEILQYLTRVMRGEEKDQFGLDVPISERTRAAQELARRIIDIPKKEESERDTEVHLIIQRRHKEEVVVEGDFVEVDNSESEVKENAEVVTSC